MQTVSESLISNEEMEKGALLLHCFTCQRATKHVTLVNPPAYIGTYRAKISRKEFVKRSIFRKFKKKRKCLECGNVTKF